jgi:hypothetical protein
MKTAPGQFLVLGLRIGLSTEWRYRARNTLDDSKLLVTLWNTHPPFPGIHFDKPRMLDQETFFFDVLPSGQYCWASEGYAARSFETDRLADHILKRYIDAAESYQPDSPSDDD